MVGGTRRASRPAELRPPRLAVVHCPQWPVLAARCEPDEAVAVIRSNRVVARSVAAGRGGVRVGQRRREAQARCPQLRLVAHDPVLDARAFHAVADAVAGMVPRLEITRPGVLTFATRGPSRYFGGDDAMASRIETLVDDVLGAAAAATGRPGVGVADGRFAAAVAGRLAGMSGAGMSGAGMSGAGMSGAGMSGAGMSGAGMSGGSRAVVVAPGESPEFLAPLPLRWLIDAGDVPAAQVELFRRLGLSTLGDLAGLDELHVTARFGRAGVEAHRMASGRDHRPPGTEEPPEALAVVHHFDQPVPHLDAVVFAGRILAERLVELLARQGRVCTQMVIVAETDHAERSERVWSLSSGLSVAAMIERIRWQLDGWATTATGDGEGDGGGVTGVAASGSPSAGIAQLRLEPTEVRADEGVQLGLWGGRTQADDWARRAATRLAGLVGDEHVVVAQHRGGRHPADADRWVPASLGSSPEAPGASAPWPGSLPAPSPAILRPEHLGIDVLDRQGRPVAVSGRGVVSAAPARLVVPGMAPREITAWAGPWVVDERWWDTARQRRQARFQLLTADGAAVVAAIERQRWWLVAEYA